MENFKKRIANAKSCVDSSIPRSFKEKEDKGGLSPSKKHVSAKERQDLIALDNMLLAKRIFKIMDSPAPISSTINDNRHLNVGVGSMNFRARVEETQRIQQRNMEFALRLEKVEPVYGYDDLHANRGVLAGKEPKMKMKKTGVGRRKKSGDGNDGGMLTARSDGAALSPRGEPCSIPRAGPGGNNKRIFHEATIKQDGQNVAIIIIKDSSKDSYAIFGASKDEQFQRYELRLSSEEISSTIDGDILVTSIEKKEVWETLVPKVTLDKTMQFGKIPGINPEEYLKRKVTPSSTTKSPLKPSGAAPSNRGGRAGRQIKSKTKTNSAAATEEPAPPSGEPDEHEAATKLQAMHRAKLAKRKVSMHREMKKAAEEIGDSEEVHSAASRLQAMHRAKLAKKEVSEKMAEKKEQHEAAARLQAIHRGKSAKKEANKKREEARIAADIGDSDEVHQAAAKLQAVQRRRGAAKVVEEKKAQTQAATAAIEEEKAEAKQKPRPPSTGKGSARPKSNGRPRSRGATKQSN